MAIEKYTKENYDKYNSLNIESPVYYSEKDNLVYTGKDYYTRTYKENEKPVFPSHYLDLLSEYYNCKLTNFLKQKQKSLGKEFVEKPQKEVFRQNELKECNDKLTTHWTLKYRNQPEKFDNNSTVKNIKEYKLWLENINYNDKPKKDISENNWFKVGVLFATGKIQLSPSKQNKTLNQIARDLENNSYRPIIAQTINDTHYQKNNKNIFDRTILDIEAIIEHCQNKGVEIELEFLKKFEEIKNK